MPDSKVKTLTEVTLGERLKRALDGTKISIAQNASALLKLMRKIQKGIGGQKRGRK
jgi:hypothetical protein